MDSLVLVAKILYYLLFVLALFLYAKYKYKKDKIKKFGAVALVVFAILFGIYGIICGPPGESVGDRANYALRFGDIRYEYIVRRDSPGLYAIEWFLHLFTTQSSVLFFLISVIYFSINIYCYKKIKGATPLYLLLFFLSVPGLYGFFALKQALALAFTNLAFTKYLQNKKWWAIVFLVVAILCHEAAWVVIPCFLIAKFCEKTNKRRVFVYVLASVLILFFPWISNLLIGIAGLIPGMAAQLSRYLDESGLMIIDINVLTVFKSLAYYIITIVALVYRKKLKNKIENYDFLLILAVLCSTFLVLSMYMYWMFRFALFFYVPIFVFAISIYEKCEDDRKKKIFMSSVIIVLFVFMLKLLIQHYFIYGGIV